MKKAISMIGQLDLFASVPAAKPVVSMAQMKKDWEHYELWYSSKECIARVEAILREARAQEAHSKMIDDILRCPPC